MAVINSVRCISTRIGSKKIKKVYRVAYDTGNVREYDEEKLPAKVSSWIYDRCKEGRQCILKEEVITLIGYRFKNIEEELT